MIAAVNCVALTNVVTRALPLKFATDELTKLVPVNVNVNAAPPEPAVVGEIDVSVGTGFGAVIVNVSVLEVVPRRARWLRADKNTVGVKTLTEAVPAGEYRRR